LEKIFKGKVKNIFSATILIMVSWYAIANAQKADSLSLHAWKFVSQQLQRTVTEFGDDVKYPRSTLPDGKWKSMRIHDWTIGFFPGCLWYTFEKTHDSFFREVAERWTESLESLQFYERSHDIGFMVFSSYGNGCRLTKNEKYRKVILQAAQTLATRFNPKVGCIKSWNKPKWEYPVIIDNMMNLELLFWASQNGGAKKLYDIAYSHAEKTMANHLRPDGSTYHLVCYDSTTGSMRSQGTQQGFSDSSCWSRGQAWAIYGFTMTYRFTKYEKFLQTAQKAADYYIAHLPADLVPCWDFQAQNIPNEPRDASAAAVAATGLFELSTYITDPTIRKKYSITARNILQSLCSSKYLAEGTISHGILNHCVGDKPLNSEVDVSLIYGDYYFLEALIRSDRIQ
jgi:hypothetical protein